VSPRARSVGVPRLQEIEFLAVAAEKVESESTYDQIRRALIEHMAADREQTQPSGNHAALRLARHDEHRYMNNATAALAGLMRLGFVQQAQLPTTRKAAPIYASRTFRLTPDGRAWVDQLRADRRGAYDELLRVLWITHPQLAGFLRLLRTGTFTVPTANWGEVHRERHVGPEGREAYVRFLAARAARAVEAGVTGWRADEQEIGQAIRAYIEERQDADDRRQRPDRYLRNRDFVGACEEALVSFAFRSAGVRLDYITLEILRRWTKQLGVANFSYHVPAPPALRIWATADLEEDGQGQLTTIRRRTVGEWGDRVIDELQAAFELARAPQGDTFVPIYQVRAAVCSKLGLNDPVFDAAVREFLGGERRAKAPFSMSCDSVEYRNTPPTETPLRVRDKAGRMHTYRVITLIPR
jgi:hypothetical protein